MERELLQEEITAFTDNEINDRVKSEAVAELIATNRSYGFDHQKEMAVKNLLRERFGEHKAPEETRRKVLLMLKTEQEKINRRKTKTENFFSTLFSRPGITYTAFAGILLLFLSAFFADSIIRFDPIAEQQGDNNMVVQAKMNFDRILSGTLMPQIKSRNPEEVKTFFRDSGVPYETIIHECSTWNLAGGVVSDCFGEKLAHNLYTNSAGDYLYIYQASKDMITDRKVVELGDEIIEDISRGKVLKNIDRDESVYVWEKDNRIFVLVTNNDDKEITRDIIK